MENARAWTVRGPVAWLKAVFRPARTASENQRLRTEAAALRMLESEREALAEEKIPVCAVGVQDRFGEVGKLPYLREVTGLTVENIVASAKKALTLK